MDESGKVDINTAPEVILKNLFMNHGVRQEDADTIVDSIMDWKDQDNLTRLHGAEDDYYMSLQNPYKAKNADFETLEELLLVKGITPEILYGTEVKGGVIDFLTVNSGAGKINIYAAPREVLKAIPGMSDDLINAIMTNRDAGNIQALQNIIGQNQAQMLPYILLADTNNTFTIESSGFKGAERTGYTVRATVTLDSAGKYRYLYYKSPAI
jgi:general secretion pathway protein K